MKLKKSLIILIILVIFFVSINIWFKSGREKPTFIRIANSFAVKHKYKTAVFLLKINTKIYPNSAMAFSALAKGYSYKGYSKIFDDYKLKNPK